MELVRCASCGSVLQKDHAVFVDGDYYCDTCQHEKNGLHKCQICGEFHAEDVMTEINGEWYCLDCLEESDEWHQCHECSDWVHFTDSMFCADDDEWYCEDCADGKLTYCEYCEEYYFSDNTVHIVDRDEYWCIDCAERNATKCEDCGDWFARDGHYVRGMGYVCNDCYERGDYFYCDECGDIVRGDEWDFDEECCCRCAESMRSREIRDYHCPPELKWYGEPNPSWRGRMRGIGVEVEIDRNGRDRDAEEGLLGKLEDLCPNDEIYFEYDGSLDNGFEIITQPHTIKAFYEMPWKEILQACVDYGYSAHEVGTCGLHMHISREFFGNTEEVQNIAIAKLIQFYELYWGDCLKVSRRTEEQARHWAHRYGIIDREYLETKHHEYGHYMAVNTGGRDTVELRLTRGTLKYESFMACIDFMLTVCKNSRTIGWSKTTDAARWLKGIKRSTLAYIIERGAFDAVRSRIEVADEPVVPINPEGTDEWNDHHIWCVRGCNNRECIHHSYYMRVNGYEPDSAPRVVFADCPDGHHGMLNDYEAELEARYWSGTRIVNRGF